MKPSAPFRGVMPNPPRPRLVNALQHFLQAPETVFVLVGMSGTGKSWKVVDWITHVLEKHIRLLIPGTDLDREDQRSLTRLVALHIRLFTSAPISDEDILAKLRSVARIEENGPFVIVLDNLIPTGDSGTFRRSLARLVAECRTAGIKLVLTGQTHIWDFYRLGQEFLSSDIYHLESESLQTDSADVSSSNNQTDSEHVLHQSTFSFILHDFTPDEQEQALRQRLSNNMTEHVAYLLRAPAFAPLRRPYLLERYLEQHKDHLQSPNVELVPVDIDALLDKRLEMLLLRVASRLDVDEQDVKEAFDALQRELWDQRSSLNVVTIAAAAGCLEGCLPGDGSRALAVLRQEAVLTVKGRLRLAEAPLADRIFARTLREQHMAGNDVVNIFRLEDDTGVVSALLRCLAKENPVSLAEALLKRDRRWMWPITEGLAQCSSQDYRVLAFLTILTRLDEGIAEFEGCDALGHLAVYGFRRKLDGVVCEQRAFEWVMQLYVSSRRANRLRGSRALSITLDLAPQKVERAMRLRLRDVNRLDVPDSSEREKRDEWLSDMLLPLLNINHRFASQVGKRILTRSNSRGVQGAKDAQSRFLREMDEVRGRIALVEDEEMDRLLLDLRNSDSHTRGHAALALRSVVIEKPEMVQEIICKAIQQETDEFVMNYLLWASYRLIELIPGNLLAALSETFALNWSIPSSSTGEAIAVLSTLGLHIPECVVPLLPLGFEAYPDWSRAWLSEGLAFAWWTCAERIPEACEVLVHLATPNLTDIPKEFHILALRGAVIAQLGVLCLNFTSTKELHDHQSHYPRTSLQFLFVNTTDFVQVNAANILAQAGSDQLLDLLIHCLTEEQRVVVHPIDKALSAARDISAFLCMEMLILLAVVHPDPVVLLERLSLSWRVVYATRRLLEAERQDERMITFARKLCDASIIGHPVQELGERKRLLMRLERLSKSPIEVLHELRATTYTSPFTADDHAGAVAELADENLNTILDLLAQNLESEDDLAALNRWAEQTRSWQGLLITKVYVRMFDIRPIHQGEAYELCQQMLTAVQNLPSSANQQEYLLVYKAIANTLEGISQLLPTVLSPNTTQNVIHHSHAFALEIVQESLPTYTSEQEAREYFIDFLASAYGKGWWMKAQWYIDGDTVGYGSSRDIIYVFPAVRLALIAKEIINRVGHTSDPAAQFLTERVIVSKILSKHASLLLNPQFPHEKESLEHVLDALKAVEVAANRDERVRLYRGLLLLQLHRLDEAEAELQRALIIPSCINDTRGSVLYNLACVYARTDRENLCNITLQEAIGLWPLCRQNLQTDPDFAAVREHEWFQNLL